MITLLDTLSFAQDTLANYTPPIVDEIASVKSIASAVVDVDSLVMDNQIKTPMNAAKNVPSYTDWIQAGAAVIAAVGVVWNLFGLRRDSQNQQNQINKLSMIAQRLESQYNFDKAKRKQDLQPHFFEEGINLDTEFIQYYHLKLKNRGETAKNLRIEIPEDAAMAFENFSNGVNNNSLLRKDEIIEMNFRKNGDYNTKELIVFKLYFEDIDGNKYSQKVIRDYEHNYTIFPPTVV